MKRFSAIHARYREGQRLLAERALQQGKKRFVWVHGVLGFGGLIFVVVTALEYKRYLHELLAGRNLEFLLFSIFLYGFIGYAWGNWKWWRMNRIASR